MAYDVIKQIPETQFNAAFRGHVRPALTTFPFSIPRSHETVKTLNDKSGYANGTRLCHSPGVGGRGWGTPYNGLYGEAPSVRGNLFQASGILKGREFTSYSI